MSESGRSRQRAGARRDPSAAGLGSGGSTRRAARDWRSGPLRTRCRDDRSAAAPGHHEPVEADNRPCASCTTGTPPPGAQTTIRPASRSCRIAPSCTIWRGSGDGTARRQRSPSGHTVHPCRSATSLAWASVYKGPMNLDGDLNAGSSPSLTTRVITATVSWWSMRVELHLEHVADLPARRAMDTARFRLGIAHERQQTHPGRSS